MISKQKNISYMSMVQLEKKEVIAKESTYPDQIRNSINRIADKTNYDYTAINAEMPQIRVKYKNYYINPNTYISPIIGVNALERRTITQGFNNELESFQKQFAKMNRTTGSRQIGVSNGWKYERAEVKIGGKGTRNWTLEERRELLENGRVRNIEGHHINNVSDHPELQSEPNNIKFLRQDRSKPAEGQEHFKEHNNNWDTKTEGAMLNRDKQLIRSNNRRVFRNEISGVGLAAAIGLGTGFAIGFMVSLAQNGLNPSSLKYAFSAGSKTGIENSIMGASGHVIGRSIGTIAGDSLSSVIVSQLEGRITQKTIENVVRMFNEGIVGSLTIMAFCAYQFSKLKIDGYSTKECLLRTSKTAGMSFSILLMSVIAQGVYGGCAGIIVSIVSGVLVTGCIMKKTVSDRNISKELLIYTVSLYKPCYV